jgi:hypothetical protein
MQTVEIANYIEAPRADARAVLSHLDRWARHAPTCSSARNVLDTVDAAHGDQKGGGR